MSKSKHGTLQLSFNDEWYFYPDKHTTTDGILLSDFSANCQSLMDTGQLFKGHAKFRNVHDTRNQLSLRDCVLRHVSAHGLKSLIAPSSLKVHQTLDPTDKQVWDAAYDEEYDGLCSLPSWEVVTEDQYHQLSKGRLALPTMAIATIKYDEHNKPKCVKYHIVVLGNLDYHTCQRRQLQLPSSPNLNFIY